MPERCTHDRKFDCEWCELAALKARVAELEASEAQLALVLEGQDRTLIRYREALEFYSISGNQRENDQGGIARAAIAYKP